VSKFIVYDDEKGHVVNVESIDTIQHLDLPNSSAKSSIRIGTSIVHSELTVSELTTRINKRDGLPIEEPHLRDIGTTTEKVFYKGVGGEPNKIYVFYNGSPGYKLTTFRDYSAAADEYQSISVE